MTVHAQQLQLFVALTLLVLVRSALTPSSESRTPPAQDRATLKLLWINPVGTDVFDPYFRAFLDKMKQPDTQVDVVSLARGPRHLEYHFYESLAAADTLDIIRRAEREGYHVAVIGCFYDPFLFEAREIVGSMTVAAPAESSLHIASSLGNSFSVIVGRRKHIPQLKQNIRKYGLEHKLASFRAVDLGVLDFQVDPAHTQKLLSDAARRAVEEDGAEVIILGCTVEFGFYEAMQEELGVPVVDVVAATLAYAEMLGRLPLRFGWGHSKVYGYESPPQAELDEWGLLEQYGYAGNDADQGEEL